MARDLLAETEPSFTQVQPRNLLADPTQNTQMPSNQLQSIEDFLATPGEILLKAGQTMSNIVGGLPGAQPLAREIVGVLPESARRGLASLQVRGDIAPQATTAANILGPVLGAGTAAELGGAGVGAALETSPALAGLAKLVERFPRIARSTGTAAFGALTDPENRARGALLGAGLGAGAEALTGAPQIAKFGIEKAKTLFSPFAPETEAQNILSDLGKGQNLEENSKSLATLIRNKFKDKTTQSSSNFNSVLNKVGSKEIEAPQTLAEAKDAIDEFTPNLKKVFNKFKENPTFENAHNLRVDLGEEIGLPILTRADRSAQQSLRNVRDVLKSEMDKFLESSPEAGNTASEYQGAIDFHRNEVIPYKSHTALRKIATGEIKNPRNISTIFKSPEGEEEAQNFTKTLKVLDDIGQEGNDRILYNELGKSKNANDLINRFNKLDQQRLGSFVNPEIGGKIEGLGNKIARKELAQRAAGGLGGAALGSLSGFPVFGTATGATIGATALPKILRGLARRSLGVSQREISPQASMTPQNLQQLSRLLLLLRASNMGNR